MVCFLSILSRFDFNKATPPGIQTQGGFQSYQGSILTFHALHAMHCIQILSILSRFDFNWANWVNQRPAGHGLSILSRFDFNVIRAHGKTVAIILSILSRFDFNLVLAYPIAQEAYHFQSYQGSILTRF